MFKNEPVGFFSIHYFFPECKDGFDVVIANPPYGIKMDNQLRDEYGFICKEGTLYRFVHRAVKTYASTGKKSYAVLHMQEPTEKSDIPSKRAGQVEEFEKNDVFWLPLLEKASELNLRNTEKKWFW